MTPKDTMENVSDNDPSATDATSSPSNPEEATSQSKAPSDNQKAEAEDLQEETEAADTTLEEQLEAAQGEARENHDRFLRVAAELDNFRKRKEREIGDLRKYANQSLLKELLAVVDNLERALESGRASGQPEALAEGVEMTLKELLKIFQRFGVTPIEALAQPFDPNHHEAVMQEPSDAYPTNTVIRELQKGYLLRERLLRPAMVVVSTESA
jgi:molecular chaperone GrpE